MSRYIDIEPYEKDGWYLQKTYHNKYCEAVKTTPLASVPTAELAMRCKDCKWWHTDGVCRMLSSNHYPVVYMEADDFCSRGKRKESEE